ncbi:MAG: peroxide stress protein YaaA [Flavobacteriaceae bacterium]|jgi:cytoplasmic iron level regulating protein YaaA (DUF328/UPF0246 family)|nr:peroxide stress protein YaaA [Flavobacteriaceae bacterium]
MKIVISPAKSLDYTTALPTTKESQPDFLKEAKVINEVLKTKTPQDLGDLMKISTALSDLNWQRNQDRTFKQNKGNKADFRPAVYAFNGDVYAGLDAYSLTTDKLDVLEQKLRILSGLYGLLKPFDSIEPYRLEMGTKMAVGTSKNLYEFWKPIVANALNKQMEKGELLVNLASTEYFSAIDKKVLKANLVTPDFKELRDGKLKVISFFAKKARGMMVRYIIDNNIEDIEGLKGFNIEGYGFSEEHSKNNNLVFIR